MKNRSRVIAILLLGGNGTRFGSSIPKQYLEIEGMPLMAYPLLALERAYEVDKIVMVVSEEYKKKAIDIAKLFGINKLMGTASSGATREESVQNALNYLVEKGAKEDDIVLIHDGDRPNPSFEIISNNVEAAYLAGAAVTALASKDSVILSSNGETIEGYANRKNVYRAQTPQTFKLGVILDAMKKQGIDFTDDGSIVAANGGEIRIVEGDERNIKITTKEDLVAFLAMKGV